MKKYGQLHTQIFIYIFAIIIVSILLILGYKYFFVIKENLAKSNIAVIQNKLTSDLKTISTEYGSIKKVSYSVKNLNLLCLVDLTKKVTILESEEIKFHPLVKDSIASGAKKNIFAFDKSILSSYYVKELGITTYPYFKCIRTKNGIIEFNILGKGDKAIIFTHYSEIDIEDDKGKDSIDIFDLDVEELDDIAADLSFNGFNGMDSIIDDIENT